ncbi:MAG: metal ABC transporter solute-binding protein, Zn/Mn family [Pseudobdellovibrionaceae bacterium]
MKAKQLVAALVMLFLNAEIASAKLKVVTTFSVIEDLTRTIGTNNIEITNLVPAGEDPHLFEPKPSDIEKLKSADLIFANGLMFEPWLNKLVSSSKTKAKVSIISYKITPRQLIDDGHSVTDPHAWNSPRQVLKYIDAIAERLSSELPKDREQFRNNSEKLKAEINEIYKKYQIAFDKIPKARRAILTTHDAGFYLCEDFEIKSLSPIGLSTSEEFKTQDLTKLIDDIETYSIKTIFSEKSHHQLLSEKLAKKAKLSLGKPLYLDGLSIQSEPASTVTKMLNYNLEQIKKSLE